MIISLQSSDNGLELLPAWDGARPRMPWHLEWVHEFAWGSSPMSWAPTPTRHMDSCLGEPLPSGQAAACLWPPLQGAHLHPCQDVRGLAPGSELMPSSQHSLQGTRPPPLVCPGPPTQEAPALAPDSTPSPRLWGCPKQIDFIFPFVNKGGESTVS